MHTCALSPPPPSSGDHTSTALAQMIENDGTGLPLSPIALLDYAHQRAFFRSYCDWTTEEDAIRIGNDIVFGLAAGVWTSDLGRAFRMSEKLKAGTVWVNTYRAVSFMTPFGGYKRSGQGRESGQEAIKEFMQVKSVWIAQQTTSSNPFIMQ